MAPFSYMFAPMEDTSDTALRTLCHHYGADLTFTEMARFEKLAIRNKSTMFKASCLNDIPTQIQIVGANETMLQKYLKYFRPHEGFQGFNLNLGCPSFGIVKIGQGCAMIKRMSKVARLVDIIKKHKYPCSIKMRLGMNQNEKEKNIHIKLIKHVDADFFVVHARHGSEHYETRADTSVYPECVATGKPIIANGDIGNQTQVAKLRKVGVAGVMLGRYAVYNPGIFNELKGISIPPFPHMREEYEQLAVQYNTPKKYMENVLKRLGKESSLNLTKAELQHVQG